MTANTTMTAAQKTAHYNLGWNDALLEFDGRLADAHEIADAMFEGQFDPRDAWGHLNEMPSKPYQRGWREAVWALSNADYDAGEVVRSR